MFFRKAIDEMAAGGLDCLAIAYRSYEFQNVPTDPELLAQWELPEDDLVLLAIVGIGVTPPETYIHGHYYISVLIERRESQYHVRFSFFVRLQHALNELYVFVFGYHFRSLLFSLQN